MIKQQFNNKNRTTPIITQAQTGSPAILLFTIELTPPMSEFGGGLGTPVPWTSPLDCPLAPPVACPLAEPVACPLALPVACPLALPVACPLAPPVACPLAAPAVCPLAEAVAGLLGGCPVAVAVAVAVAMPVAVAVVVAVAVAVAVAVVLPVVAAVDPAPPVPVTTPPPSVCPQHGPPELNTFTVDVVRTELEPVVAAVDVALPGMGVALPVVWKVRSPVMMAGLVMVPVVKVEAKVTVFGSCAQLFPAFP